MFVWFWHFFVLLSIFSVYIQHYMLRVSVSLHFLPYLSGMQIACAILYRHLWPVWLYHISPNYIKKGTIFERKKMLNTECVF